ncbi:MAG: PilW family protein [Burkholderiales bacterium]|jgi:type IV pilus assembly protein PilW|nr:PilW family protein [Burkholderiales bacterium]
MRAFTNFPRALGAARERGLSLVEILVGVLIAMIGIVVIFSVLAVAESRKRTTAAGSDAQTAGAIALFSMERDLKQSGYGFGTFGTKSPINCLVDAYDAQRPTPDFDFPLAPVMITQGAGGAPDTLIAFYGNSPLIVAGKSFTFSGANAKQTSSSLGGRTGLMKGDVLLIAGQVGASLQCQLIEVTDNTNADAVTINHATGSYTPEGAAASVNARYNKATGPAFVNGFIYDLGNAPTRSVWSIQAANGVPRLVVQNDLRWSDADADGNNDVLQVFDDVIDLQAEYGVAADTNGDGQLDRIGAWQTAAPADMSTVYAVRFAILARSKQAEKEKVTNAAPQWAAGAFTMTNVDGAADSNPGDAAKGEPNNWRNYRYRVYETLVPLRNLVWGNIP